MAEDTKIVISAIDKTSKGFRSVSNGLKSMMKSVFSLKTALAGLAGAAGFGFLIKKNLDAIDVLKKTADKIGTTTDALSALHHVAETTGVRQETLNMAMQRFTRRLSEATNGTGEAKNALKKLNIDADELIKLPLDEQMFVLADAFNDVETQAEAVALAMKLFDSEGVALVNTLALGSRGIKDLMLEADQLGLVLSHDAAAGVEKANDALTRLFAITKGLFRQLTAALAPAIQTVADYFKDLSLKAYESAGGLKGVGETIAKFLLGSIVKIIKGLEDFVNTLIRVKNAVQNAFREIFGDMTDINAVKSRLKDINEEFEELGENFTNTPEQNALFNSLMEESDKLEVKLAELMDNTPEVNWSKTISSINQLIAQIGKIETPVEEAIDEIAAMGDPSVWAAVYAAWDKFGESVNRVSPALFDVKKDMDNLAVSTIKTVTNSLTAAVTGTEKFSDAMKNMAKSIIDSLIQMYIQYQIVKPLFEMMFGPIDGGGGGSTGGGGVAGQKAIGGSVQNGSSYLVGERGPEIFTPNASGAIVPNKNMGGGGVTINQTINISTGVAQTVRAEVANLMPQIANAAKGAVIDARQRGGTYSKSLIGA